VHGGVVQQIRPAAGPYTPKFFTASEYKLVSRIADLIIPNTDTPGAVAAGVPEYIDGVVSGNEGQQKRFREGLAWMEKAGFAEMSEAEQIKLLTPLCEAADSGKMKHAGDRFFLSMKSLTADGYYTSQAGLSRDLGYQGGAVLAAFPECNHPEHKG
jgi:gluconate 2-dehydrogenase gamma chain